MSTRDKVRELMAQGKDPATIAEEIGIQAQTVKYHIDKIKEEDEVIKIKAMNSIETQDDDGPHQSDDPVMIRDYLQDIDQILDLIGGEMDKAAYDAALTICVHILTDGFKEEFDSGDEDEE